MSGRYENIRLGLLSEYITPDKFRTIGEDMRDIPIGLTEYAVEIQMKKKSKGMLSFKTPWDGIIYGCARDKRELKEKASLEADVKKVYLVDWDTRFLLLAESENSEERPLIYVPTADVINLLENCRRVPEQKNME